MPTDPVVTPVPDTAPPQVKMGPDGYPVKEEWELRMGRGEAARSRKPELRDQLCCVYSFGNGWWDQTIQAWSYNNNPKPMHTLSVGHCIAYFGSDVQLYIDARPDDPANPRRRCIMEHYVAADVVKLLKLAPNNASFRARLMACHNINEMPPKEADTFEKLKDWVEFTFPRPPKKDEQPRKKRSVEIAFVATEEEEGSCKYKRTRRYTGATVIDEDKIREIIGESDTMDGVYCRIGDLMEDRARDGNVTTEDEETRAHQVDDADGIYMQQCNYTEVNKLARTIALEVIPADERQEFGLE